MWGSQLQDCKASFVPEKEKKGGNILVTQKEQTGERGDGEGGLKAVNPTVHVQVSKQRSILGLSGTFLARKEALTLTRLSSQHFLGIMPFNISISQVRKPRTGEVKQLACPRQLISGRTEAFNTAAWHHRPSSCFFQDSNNMPPQGSFTNMNEHPLLWTAYYKVLGLKSRQTPTGQECRRKAESLKIDLLQSSSVSVLTEGSRGVLAAGEDSDSNLELAPERQGKSMQQRHRPSSGQGNALAAGLLGKRKEGGIHV